MALQATLNKVRDIVSAGSEQDALVKAHKNTNRVPLGNFGEVATHRLFLYISGNLAQNNNENYKKKNVFSDRKHQQKEKNVLQKSPF